MNNREEFRFQFRTEKTSEIVKCLHELGIQVNEADILNPEKSKEQIQFIFEQLAELCTGITREEMNQASSSGSSALTFPELYDESTSLLNNFRACSKMMETCGINSFSIKDIMYPESKKVRRYLSGIINFLKFREEKLALLSELSESRDVLIEKLSTQRAKAESTGTRLNRLKEQTAEDSRLISRTEEEIKEIESKILSLNQQQNDTRDEITDLKDKSTKLKEEIEKKSVIIEELQTSKKTYTSQVVSSPEKFRKRIVDTGVALQNEQKEAKLAERRIRELSSWIGNVEDARVEVDVAMDAINDFRLEIEKQKTIVTDLDTIRQINEVHREHIEEMEQNIQQSTRSSTRYEEKLTQYRKGSQQKLIEKQQSIQELQESINKEEGLQMKLGRKAKKYEQENDRIGKEIEEEQRHMEQEIIEMIHSYKGLESLVLKHLQDFTQTLHADMPIHTV